MLNTMKVKLYISIAMVAIAALAAGCKKDLDSFPTTVVSEPDYWKTPNDVKKFVNDIYGNTFYATGGTYTYWEGSIFFDEMMSDNTYLVWEGWFTDVKKVANSTLDVNGSTPAAYWQIYYANIRKCNKVYENIGKVSGLSEADKSTLLAEVKFIEAYNYHKLAFFFGNVPLITQSLNIQEAKTIKQSDRATVIAHVLKRLDEAIATLNGKTMDKGRATWGAATMLKARVLLYENRFADLLPVTDQLVGKYSLHTSGTAPYADLFNGNAENSNEIIFSIGANSSVGSSIQQGHIGNQIFFLKGMSGGDALLASTPTGSMIDAYPMADGRFPKEPGSNYNPAQPYLNRDPRFYQSIIYPTGQMKYLNGDVIDSAYYDPEDADMQFKLQLYNAPEPSPTGFMWTKYVQWTPLSMVRINDCSNDIILMRYADVLLMRAEALAETQGAGAKAAVAGIINQLRSRVGAGPVHEENYQSKDQLIQLVRNERRVELANEGLRYYDIIRWKVAEKRAEIDGYGLAGQVFGARMRKDGIGSTDRTIVVDGQQRRWVEERFFNPSKNYLLPIPQHEIDLNGNLIQNPGWRQ